MEITLPYFSDNKDFTIIYKGREEREGQIIENLEEIKTSKAQFLSKLRYFKRKTNEINNIHEIFIHDVYPNGVFKEFIDSLTTRKIQLTENNYEMIKKLSFKYEYNELFEEVDRFSKTRPDINEKVSNYILKKNIDYEEEEELSMHLDICLQNDNMLKFPVEVLNRIINSPKRVLHDHHLLFKFIKKVISKHSSSSDNKSKNNYYDKVSEADEDEDEYKKEKENIQILLSSLDYSQMSKEELQEIFENENYTSIFDVGGSKKKIQSIFEENKLQAKRITALEKQIETFSKQIECILKKQEQSVKEHEEQQNLLDCMSDRIESQEKHLNQHNTKIEQLQKLNDSQKILEDSIAKMDDQQAKRNIEFENQIESISKQINGIVAKEEEIMLLNEKNLKQNDSKIEEQLKLMDPQVREIKMNKKDAIKLHDEENREFHENYVKNLEERICRIEDITSLHATINTKVNPNQTIECTINVKEKLSTLDRSRSKFILNSNGNGRLGENAYDGCTRIENLTNHATFMKSAGTYFLHALLVDSAGQVKELVSGPLCTKGCPLMFEFTGRVETVTLGPGSYKLEVWGAEGGKTGDCSDTPGKGGYSCGILKLRNDKKLYIHVGECPQGSKGGWNGGGDGGKRGGLALQFQRFMNGSACALGGGGSTDISLHGEEGCENWNNEAHLYSRIIVAGGGGGSDYNGHQEFQNEFGDGWIGQKNGNYQQDIGGTQLIVNRFNDNSMRYGFGIGESCKNSSSGGGGGWYGGRTCNDNFGCPYQYGGAGGSGYVYSLSTASLYPRGCMLDNSFFLSGARTLGGDQPMPDPRSAGSTEKGHKGHGFARITFI